MGSDIDGGGAWHRVLAPVTSVDRAGPACVRIEFRCRAIAAAASPGQFIMVRVSDSLEPLLRRPLSVHDVDGERIAVAVAAVGRGTRILSRARTGDDLAIDGPHGRGFGVPRPGNKLVLVGGGIGAAPLLFAARRQAVHTPVTVVLGAPGVDRLLSPERFSAAGADVIIATDDGSAGLAGTAVDALARILSPDCEVWACGPRPMLAATAALCGRQGVSCRVSVEANFACGVGACYGCVIPGRDGGYLRTCRDGPVFEAEEVAW